MFAATPISATIAYVGLAVIVYVAIKMIYEGWVDPGVGIGTLFG